MRKHLFWFMISEVSVHVWSFALGLRQYIRVERTWWSSTLHLMAAGKQSERQEGDRDNIYHSKTCPAPLVIYFLQTGAHSIWTYQWTDPPGWSYCLHDSIPSQCTISWGPSFQNMNILGMHKSNHINIYADISHASPIPTFSFSSNCPLASSVVYLISKTELSHLPHNITIPSILR
jgi:hypothetical protein